MSAMATAIVHISAIIFIRSLLALVCMAAWSAAAAELKSESRASECRSARCRAGGKGERREQIEGRKATDWRAGGGEGRARRVDMSRAESRESPLSAIIQHWDTLWKLGTRERGEAALY